MSQYVENSIKRCWVGILFLVFFVVVEVLANYYHYCSFFWKGAKISEIF